MKLWKYFRSRKSFTIIELIVATLIFTLFMTIVIININILKKSVYKLTKTVAAQNLFVQYYNFVNYLFYNRKISSELNNIENIKKKYINTNLNNYLSRRFTKDLFFNKDKIWMPINNIEDWQYYIWKVNRYSFIKDNRCNYYDNFDIKDIPNNVWKNKICTYIEKQPTNVFFNWININKLKFDVYINDIKFNFTIDPNTY